MKDLIARARARRRGRDVPESQGNITQDTWLCICGLTTTPSGDVVDRSQGRGGRGGYVNRRLALAVGRNRR